jgi:hypothetical protein
MRGAAMLCAVGCAWTLGCGGATPATTGVHDGPARPDEAAAMAAGEFLWREVVGGHTDRVLASEDTLNTLLAPEARSRLEVVNASKPDSGGGEASAAARDAEYVGVCIQTLRRAPAGPPIGLRRPAWIFEHVLVMGRSPDGPRVGFWLDGLFVFTDQGLRALDLRAVNAPAPETTEMALALCDLQVGVRSN